MSKYYIMMGYMVFFCTFLALQGMVGGTYLTGLKNPSSISCDLGLVIIDGLLRCAWQWLQYFFSFFNLSTSIGILNTILLIPFLVFLIMYIIGVLRGTG